ncbi:MAG: hypothetical protein ACYC6Z_07510 [Thermoleophilia bacterium]
MAPINVKDLAPGNRAERNRRLRELKHSVETRSYQINASMVAGGILREASSNRAARKLSD